MRRILEVTVPYLILFVILPAFTRAEEAPILPLRLQEATAAQPFLSVFEVGGGKRMIRDPEGKSGGGVSPFAFLLEPGMRAGTLSLAGRGERSLEAGELSAYFATAGQDTVETRSSWDIAKEILLWVGVVAVVGFFIAEVFIRPNSDDDDGGGSGGGGKEVPPNSRVSLISIGL